MNIMVVDDESVQVETLSRGLKSKGYHIQEASNSEEALGYLNDNHKKIDMVITDYAMPGMDGMELLRKIRENHKSLPVIMMTAYGEKNLIIDALRNRCDSFIEKPFTLDQLIDEIERAQVTLVQNTNSHQLSELFRRLVHQINNPLMSIVGGAQLGMLELGDAEAIRKRMVGIIESTRRITGINKEILNIGYATEDKIEKVNIADILDDCLNMFGDLMILKEVSLEKELDAHQLSVTAHKFSLEQVFKNLILNAIDSMDSRPEKQLKVKAEIDEASSSITIDIHDTGCGIPEKFVDQIFNQHFTTKENGTGLGLLVVKDIVERHKGKVEVRSKAGEGTTFKVILPISE